MRIAVLSDIRGFLAPLNSALDDIRSQNVDQIVCLGDIVGVGPDSTSCIDRLRSADPMACITGDWEQYVLQQLATDELHVKSRAAVEVVRSRLLFPSGDEAGSSRLDFLASLPTSLSIGDVLFVHGSPRQTDEYIFPEDAYNTRKLEKLFAGFPKICVHGQAPIRSVIYEDGEHFEVKGPERHQLRPNVKVLVGVGSVTLAAAQGNSLGYAIVEDDAVEFR
ncbi:MAG TPA: metallophosphoesterase [Pirellulales bacterium]|nr:metallophosphoesterase [Pirellulales bacterium]